MTWSQWVDHKYPSTNFSGIYGMFVSGKCIYVGQSANIYKRFKAHARHIDNYITNKPDKEKNGMKYIYLSKVGQKQTEFKVLELCAVEDLNDRELYWMGWYDEPMFNISKKPYKRRK